MPTSNLRIAMWSGPRNISTAMMRSWGNRADAFVCDEPLYAHYLRHTGLPHPGAEEVIAAGDTDWRKVVAWLVGPVPQGKRVFFQKHMTHHLLPHIERDWLAGVVNCFLIRDPAEVIVSYLKKNGDPTADDLGFRQQVEIFDWVCQATGQSPPVLDAKDVQNDPRGQLSLLCQRLELPFDDAMLSWPPGLRESDGVWAKHWYHEVVNTTSFSPHQFKPTSVPAHLKSVHDECRRHYDRMHEHRLK